MDKSKNKNFIDDTIKRTKDIPAPSKYQKLNDWKKNHRGRFLKSARLTMSAEIMKRTSKAGGPGAFKKELDRKIHGNYK